MSEKLEECPWDILQIEECVFLAKCCRNASFCEFLVCDLNTCWYEKLTETNVMDRNSRLNPNIEASYDRLLSHIIAVFKRILSKSSLIVTRNGTADDLLRITADSYLCSLAFSWEFNLVKQADDTISNHLTKPLISMVLELYRRQRELFQIIENKDALIDDYKAEGVSLHRRHKDEQRFDKKEFEAEMSKSDKFHDLVSISNEETSFKTLYASVMKRKCESDSLQSCNKNENKVDVKEEMVESSTTLARHESAEEKSNLDKELERRQALENRLAEERTKKEIQSKKKKLKL